MTLRPETPANPPTGWWSTSPAGWPEVCEETFTRWNKNQRGKGRLGEEVGKRAMGFGFGSREQYGEHRAWKDLEEQLQADWRASGREAAHPWEQIARAVKYGWTAAAAPLEAPQKAAGADPADPSLEDAPRNVPGGRPDRPAEPAPADPSQEEAPPNVPGGRPDRHA